MDTSAESLAARGIQTLVSRSFGKHAAVLTLRCWPLAVMPLAYVHEEGRAQTPLRTLFIPLRPRAQAESTSPHQRS